MTQPKALNQNRDAVEQFFTATATDYSSLFLGRRSGSNFTFRERLNLAVQMTSGASGRLLDCACGSGEITGAVLGSGRFARATVVDLSPTMLKVARQSLETGLKNVKMDGLEFISSDIFDFAAQIQPNPYDLILCLGLIAHTGRLDDLLAGLKTLLSPNGSILLQSTLLDHLGTRIVRALTHERYYRRHGYRITYFHHRDILRAAQNVGLQAVAVRRFAFGFPFGDRAGAWLNYRLEKSMQGWSGRHGAEAIYLLQPRPREH